MTLDDSTNVVSVLTEDECRFLLESADLARIAFAFEGKVEIFPINYYMNGRIIVFRTGPGTKLNAVGKTAVAVEVDSWDPRSGIGWSVVAKGPAEEITTNPGRVAEHLRWLPVHPAAPGDRFHWIGIKPSEITGRRFQVPPTKGERT
jgi:nitroimidazol reductase NimA-like FMN-containing flavoprotein (pyridoxamine 5'-phosphate oxidase superfamily)